MRGRDDKQRKELYISVAASIILCVLIFFSAALIMDGVTQDAILEITTLYTSEMDAQIQARFNSSLKVQYDEVEKIFESISSIHLQDEEGKTVLGHEAYVCDFVYLGYITEDNQYVTIDGADIASQMEELFASRLDDGKTVGLAENSDGQELFLFVIPKQLQTKDGTRIISAVAGMEKDTFAGYLSLSLEQALTHSHIIRYAGDYVITDKNDHEDSDNYFDLIRESVSTKAEGGTYENADDAIAAMQAAMNKKEPIAIPITVSQEMILVYVAPLPVEGWYLCTALPRGPLNQALENLGNTRRITNATGSILMILAMLGMFFLYIKNMKRQLRLLTEAREEKEKALQEAVCANSAKSEFLARMSHEIRTPMNGIVGMTSIAMQNLKNEEKLTNCLQKIVVSSEQLLNLINDVLDMSKIESGKMEIIKEPFNFHIFLDNLRNMIYAQAREKNIQFEMKVEGEIAEMLVGDSLRLNQILLNLVSNGLKFTPAGGKVSLTVAKKESTNTEQWVCFKVQDTGRGIAKEHFNKIFSPFEQEEHLITRQFGGTGLGLPIVKRFTNMMGGTISVESELGKGSLFTVTLPFEYDREKDLVTEMPKSEEEGVPFFADKRILIAEDQALNMEIACELLEGTGVMLETATDGQQAVDKFADSPEGYYDLILMDVQMPEKNGYEATDEIRSMNRCDAKTIPILAMTANAFSSDVAESLEHGMNGHISKPIDIQVFYKALEKVLQ